MNRRKRGAVSLLGIVLAISGSNAGAGEDSATISWSTGLEYSSGTYGGIVVEHALVKALRAAKLGGAALDVFESEPVDAEGGKVFASILNLLLTPHIAGISEESNLRVSRVTAENVAQHLCKLEAG